MHVTHDSNQYKIQRKKKTDTLSCRQNLLSKYYYSLALTGTKLFTKPSTKNFHEKAADRSPETIRTICNKNLNNFSFV